MTIKEIGLKRLRQEQARTKCPKCSRKAYYRILTDDFRCPNCQNIFIFKGEKLHKNLREELNFHRKRADELYNINIRKNTEINFLRRKINKIKLDAEKTLEYKRGEKK